MRAVPDRNLRELLEEFATVAASPPGELVERVSERDLAILREAGVDVDNPDVWVAWLAGAMRVIYDAEYHQVPPNDPSIMTGAHAVASYHYQRAHHKGGD